jgi:hypothetical protein
MPTIYDDAPAIEERVSVLYSTGEVVEYARGRPGRETTYFISVFLGFFAGLFLGLVL